MITNNRSIELILEYSKSLEKSYPALKISFSFLASFVIANLIKFDTLNFHQVDSKYGVGNSSFCVMRFIDLKTDWLLHVVFHQSDASDFFDAKGYLSIRT